LILPSWEIASISKDQREILPIHRLEDRDVVNDSFYSSSDTWLAWLCSYLFEELIAAVGHLLH